MESIEREKDYYAVLGVSPSADRETISSAYRSKIKAIHPDSHRSVPDPDAGRHIAELVEAWRVLGDTEKKTLYDRGRSRGPSRDSRYDHSPKPPRHVPRPPVLEVSPPSLDLGTVARGEIISRRIRVENVGGTATALERTGPRPEWIRVSQPDMSAKGSSLRFPLDLTIQVDTSRLSLRQRYEAVFTLRLINEPDGVHSAEGSVAVSVAVGAEDAPRPAVRPGNWLVERCECLGAPRSLLLHLFVGNGGGGSLEGTIKSSPWMRVSSRSFGPIRHGAAPLHMVVEVDCAAWRSAGWSDGSVAVVTSHGDVREVAAIGRETLGGGRLGRGEAYWLRWFPLYVAMVATIPWLAVMGVLPVQSVWLALAGTLLQPMVFGPLRRLEMVARGPRIQAEGWSLGTPRGGRRFWLCLVAWLLMGGLLGIGVGREVAPFLSAGTMGALGAAAAAAAGLSVTSRSGPFFRPVLGSTVRLPLLDGAGWLIVSLAWSMVCALAFQAIAGGMIRWAPLWGASMGWTAGGVLAFARSGAIPQQWRRRAESIAAAGAPVLVALFGFATALALAVDLLPGPAVASSAAAMVAGSRPSALLTLPGASLSTATVATASCVGLLFGYCLGLASLLPLIFVPGPVAQSLQSARSVAMWLKELALEMVLGHARLNAEGRDAELRTGGEGVAGLVAEMHWTAMLVAASALLLLLYSSVHLLLALCAGLGIAIG